MEGVFIKRELKHKLYSVIALVSCVIDIVIMLLLLASGFEDPGAVIILAFFIVLGLAGCVFIIIWEYLTRCAYIRVDKNGISALCHYGFSLKCAYSDIENVSYFNNELTLRRTNGKKYMVLYLENAARIAGYIKRQLAKTPKLDIEELKAELLSMEKNRKSAGIGAIICAATVFVPVFAIGFLTDFKDTQDYVNSDWIYAAIFGSVAVAVFCFFLSRLTRFLRYNEKANDLRINLQYTVLLAAPLPAGNVIKIFIDEVMCDSPRRITICGIPNADEVYYCFEKITNEINIRRLESGLFPNYRHLIDEFGAVLDGMTEMDPNEYIGEQNEK